MLERRWIKPVITVGILLILAYIMFGNPLVLYHNHQLKDAVLAQKETALITLDELVPFAWDTVYTFDPYTSEEEIEEIIGFKSCSIKETVSEGMVQLLFVKGKRVTASVCGYADGLGYRIDFFDRVAYGDGTEFEVVNLDGIVSLRVR